MVEHDELQLEKMSHELQKEETSAKGLEKTITVRYSVL